MRLFLRSHVSLLFLVVFQGIFIFGYYWFLGFRQLDHLFYVFLIQLFSIALYLAYRWIQDYKLYRWLSEEEEQEFFIPDLGNSPVAESLQDHQRMQRQLMETKIRRVQTELDKRVTFMNQWVHQMKTPLSVIHLMIQEYDDQLFQNIRKELYRIEDGLKTVLYSTRLSLFEKDYTIERVVLQHLMDDVIKENKRLFIQYKVFPHKLFPQDLMYVYTDKKWIQFAVGQLISNAVKYSANKSDTLILRIEKKEQQIVLEVEDFGVGIPSQDVKRVFDPYFTGVNGRLYHESTGMGLYLVKEIVQKLHHQIELESEAGKGTLVKIWFSAGESPNDVQ